MEVLQAPCELDAISASIRDIESAMEHLDAMRQAEADARDRLEQVALSCLLDKSQEERLAIAQHLYWNTDLSTKPICRALGVSNAHVFKQFEPIDSGFTCFDCGCPIAATSRTHLRELRQERFSRRCAACHHHFLYGPKGPSEWEIEEQRRRKEIAWLRTLPYREYLKTAHWQDTRRRALRRADYRCQLCYEGGLLDVHHRTYENKGDEEYTDLTVLCRDCHARFHHKLPEAE